MFSRHKFSLTKVPTSGNTPEAQIGLLPLLEFRTRRRREEKGCGNFYVVASAASSSAGKKDSRPPGKLFTMAPDGDKVSLIWPIKKSP